MSALLDAALAYAARGWHVFPVQRPVTGDAKSGKRPAGHLVPNGKDDATADETTIRSWWALGDWNIGIACEPSCVVVLDVDVSGGKRGRESLAAIADQLVKTRTATTGSGGTHAIYARPDGVSPPQTIGFRDGLDLIGKGYFVAPPSVHHSGGAYSWDDEGPIAVLPSFLSAAVASKSAAGPAVARPTDGLIPDGQRNATLTSLAGTMRQRDMTDAAIEAALLAENRVRCNPPLPEEEVARIAASVMRYASPADDRAFFAGSQLGKAIDTSRANVPKTDATASAKATDTFLESPSEYGNDLRVFLGETDPGDDPDAWLIPGIVPAGVPIVTAGHPKSCKTFLAEHQAICLAAGIPWLGRGTRQCRVLILAREDSIRETRRRLWRLARGLGLDPRDLAGWLRVDCKTPFYFSNVEDVARMRRTLDAWRPAFVVIDSLSRTHMGDESSKKEMSIVTSVWGDLCQLYDTTVDPIHHFTKSGEGSLLQKIRGTGDIGALVRHIIGVEKQGDGTTQLSFEGNLSPLPDPFLVRMVDGTDERGLKCIRFENAGSASDAHSDRIDQEILAALVEAGTKGMTWQQVEKAVKGNNGTKRLRKEWLVTTRKIVKFNGRWFATEVKP